ncbi:MAG: glycosyltransferase, partial [Desulfobacterales bacterium]
MTLPLKKCDIIVPVYNGLSYVKDCLASILRFTPPALYNMYLVDDSSDETTRSYLDQFAQKHSHVMVCHHEKNLGFVKSCNRGLQLATAPFALIINTDAVVSPQWLERLLACAEKDPTIGMVNPLTNSAAQIAVPMPAGLNFMDVDRLLCRRFAGQMADVVTGEGFCMLLRRKALEYVGVFDEIYGRGYCEES